MIDHDKLFKELLTTFFAEFIDLFLPAVSAYLDREQIEFLDKEVFTDVTSGEKHETDIVAKVRFRNQDSFFLVHIENQADSQAEFAARMFRYFARLHEKYALPVYPIAVFSFDEPARAEPDRYTITFPNKTVLDFSFDVIQLNRLNWRDYIKKPNPVASALMAKMKIAHQDRPRVKVECLRLLTTLRLNPAKAQLISGFVDTYLRLNREQEHAFLEELRRTLPLQEREQAMQIMTSWKLEGIEEGLQQGEELVVFRQLRRKFGSLSETHEARIHALIVPQLESLAEALLDFKAVSELDSWLDSQSVETSGSETP